MNIDSIQDLDLAGVRWEIADIPLVLRAKWSNSGQTPKGDLVSQNNNVSSVGNTVVPPIAPNNVVSMETAVSMASRPADINNLIRMIGEFNHPLRSAVSHVVFPNIAKNPNGLVIVTDVPGSDDDATGHVLSGAAGDLLDKMLAAIRMNRDIVSIIPIVFWRTPGGRTPTDTEISLARPFINRLLEFLKPSVILTLGATPAKEIADVKLSDVHGTIIEKDDGMKIVPIYHPNYLLLKPSAKRDVWGALQELQNLLKIQ